ncbi:MAG: carE [Frankiales bacterium]|nr:carE [Frankiales bacterium]
MSRETTPTLPALTWARFPAALCVAMFHWHLAAPTGTLPGFLDSIARHGYLGVPFFFCLSGFVLSHRYLSEIREGSFVPFQYARNRFARIYPLYLLSLVCELPFLLQRAHDHSWSPTHLLVVVVAAPLLLQAWLPTTSLAWNTPGWSLSCEAFFYVCFALAARRPQLFTAGPMTCLAVATTALGWVLRTVTPHQWHAYFPLNHLFVFVVGVLLAVLLEARDQRHIQLAATGAVVLLPFLLWFGTDHDPTGAVSTTALTGCALIVVLALSLVRPSRDLRPLRALGSASYALYLLHYTVLEALLRLSPRSAVADRLWLVGFLVLATAVAVAAWHVLEEPARKRVLSRGRAQRLPTNGFRELYDGPA